jgi:hypothetical protein
VDAVGGERAARLDGLRHHHAPRRPASPRWRRARSPARTSDRSGGIRPAGPGRAASPRRAGRWPAGAAPDRRSSSTAGDRRPPRARGPG